MKPDFNEEELETIAELARYFESKGLDQAARDYYLMSRSIIDACAYMERGKFAMARRILGEGDELAQNLFMDLETEKLARDFDK